MDRVASAETYSGPKSAFEFHGRWQEFLPIAVTNLLLTIVTLGIYRFWAKTRERKYLWSRTQFIDDRLEWAGTGREMFVGFLIVMAILLPVILFLQFGVQALILRGQPALASILVLAAYLAIFYLGGVALFRALRYRLSRTYWHGIRGGSDNPGWRYGGQAMWRYIASFLALGLPIPWAMVSLWRQRWSAMSFGPHAFEVGEGGATSGLMGRYLMIYGAIIAFAMLVAALGAGAAMQGLKPEAAQQMGGTFVLMALGFYLVFGIASLAYYAAYFRKVVGELRLSTLQFSFNARTSDWLKLVFGNIGLVLVTFGFGLMFITYRNWSFFVRHLDATGEISVSQLTQSTTSLRTDAEGLADAFDIGAI